MKHRPTIPSPPINSVPPCLFPGRTRGQGEHFLIFKTLSMQPRFDLVINPPSPPLIQATKAYLVAKANTDVIRPIVQKIQQEVIDAHPCKDLLTGERITNIANIEEMDDE